MLQNNLKMKIIIYLIGKDLALKFVTFKISIRMKRLQTDYFQYNLNMNLKKVSKKNISFKKNLIENQLQSSEHMTKIIGRNST